MKSDHDCECVICKDCEELEDDCECHQCVSCGCEQYMLDENCLSRTSCECHAGRHYNENGHQLLPTLLGPAETRLFRDTVGPRS